MEQNMAKVTVNGETKEYPCGTSYRDIVNEYQKDTEAPIILVTVDGRLRPFRLLLQVSDRSENRSVPIFHLFPALFLRNTE